MLWAEKASVKIIRMGIIVFEIFFSKYDDRKINILLIIDKIIIIMDRLSMDRVVFINIVLELVELIKINIKMVDRIRVMFER